MDCPKCGYERQPEDTHCQLCGVDFGLLERQEEEKRALKERAKKEQESEEPIQLSMENKEPEGDMSTDAYMEEDCPKCGYERKKNDKECPNCGLIYAKHDEMMAKKAAEKEARKKAEQKKFAEEKARVQTELEKRVAEAKAKREEKARLAEQARMQEASDKDQKSKTDFKARLRRTIQPLANNPKRTMAITAAVVAVVSAIWIGVAQLEKWQKHSAEERIRIEKEQEKQRLEEKNQKIAQDFRKNRTEIENYLRSLITKRKFDAYQKEMKTYDIPMLEKDLSDLKQFFKEIQLYDRVKWLPGKEYEKNYRLYLELHNLNPGKALYSKKVAYYQKKFADQKYTQAKQYFDKRKPYRSELNEALTDIDLAIKLNGPQKKYTRVRNRLINAELLFYEGNDRVKMAVRNDGLTTGKTGGQRKLYVWIKNSGSSPFYVNVEYFTLVGRNNKKYKYNNCSRELITNLEPGETTQGYLYFYTSVQPKKLVFSHINAGTVSRVFP